MSDGPLSSLWSGEDGKRQRWLQNVKRFCVLAKPTLRPIDRGETSEDKDLELGYQSVGPRGIMNLEGALLNAMRPVGIPFFSLELAAGVMQDKSIPEAVKQGMVRDLFINELTIASLMEQSSLLEETRCRRGMRTATRQVISYLLVAGDALFQSTDDYRMKVFRPEQYVVCRDSCGDVLLTCVREKIDPLALTEDQFAQTGLDYSKCKEKRAHERMEDIYTLNEWNPRAGVWVVTQEMCGRQIGIPSEDKISAYISVAYELLLGDNYGRGFVELQEADLRTLDELDRRLIEAADMATRMHPLVGQGSQIKDDDFQKETGRVIRNVDVRGGVAQDIAFLKVDKVSDMQFAMTLREAKRKDLAAAMLMNSETIPQKERVTRAQVDAIQGELQGATGGVSAPMQEEVDMPYIRRVVFQARRDKLLLPMDDKLTNIKVTTGLAALDREQKRMKLLEYGQVVASLGPEAQSRIDPTVFMDAYQRFSSFYVHGLTKSDAQVQAEQQQMMANQAQQQAAEKGIDVLGNVVQDSLTPQAA